MRRRGSLATASGGTSWRDAVGGGGRGGRACARGVVPAASRASARFVRGTARRARSRRRHVEERQRRRARGDARHGARCFGRETAVGGPRASRSRALGDARARRETKRLGLDGRGAPGHARGERRRDRARGGLRHEPHGHRRERGRHRAEAAGCGRLQAHRRARARGGAQGAQGACGRHRGGVARAAEHDRRASRRRARAEAEEKVFR